MGLNHHRSVRLHQRREVTFQVTSQGLFFYFSVLVVSTTWLRAEGTELFQFLAMSGEEIRMVGFVITNIAPGGHVHVKHLYRSNSQLFKSCGVVSNSTQCILRICIVLILCF